MQTENLPTEELKSSESSMKICHFQKLKADDIQKISAGATRLSQTTTKTGQLSNSRKTTPD